MQADLAQSQQQKRISSENDGASESGVTRSQDSDKYVVASVASRANTTSSQAVSSSDVTDTVATGTPASRQPCLSSTGFTPFAKNPAKQKRYEAYLASQKAGTPCKSAAGFEALFC